MRTGTVNARRTEPIRPSEAAPAGAREPLVTQILAAVGYTVVIITLAVAVCASFTDDFGLEPAAIACLPVAAACLAAIRRKARP